MLMCVAFYNWCNIGHDDGETTRWLNKWLQENIQWAVSLRERIVFNSSTYVFTFQNKAVKVCSWFGCFLFVVVLFSFFLVNWNKQKKFSIQWFLKKKKTVTCSLLMEWLVNRNTGNTSQQYSSQTICCVNLGKTWRVDWRGNTFSETAILLSKGRYFHTFSGKLKYIAWFSHVIVLLN